MTYSKLDSGIVNSSIWSEPLATRVLWITMLAMSDENGFVSTSLPGLIRAANIPKDDFIAAIKALESPDEYSRTEDFEGRRVNKIEGGWVILNFKKYRERYEIIKEQTRERVQRHRDKIKSVTLHSVTETLSPVCVSVSSSEDISNKNARALWQAQWAVIRDSGPLEWINDDPSGGREWGLLFGKLPDLDHETVKSAAAAYRKYCEAAGKKGQYVIRPANWLRNGEYNTPWSEKEKDLAKKSPNTRQFKRFGRVEMTEDDVRKMNAEQWKILEDCRDGN